MRFWRSLTAYTRAYALPVHTVLLAVCCLLLQAAQPQLIYQADRLWLEPWRLWTAHVVHVGWQHAALNITALLLLPWIFPQYPVHRFWLILWLGCPLLSLCLSVALPDLLRYAGLSGILHGIYVSAAIHAWVTRSDLLVVRIFCIGLFVKLVLENMMYEPSTAELIGAPVLTQAHYFGVALVLMLSAVLGHFRPDSSQKSLNLTK